MYYPNLAKRLKPELQDQLKYEGEKYPSLYKGVKEELEKQYFVRDLTLGVALDIAIFLDKNLTDIHDLFLSPDEYKELNKESNEQ